MTKCEIRFTFTFKVRCNRGSILANTQYVTRHTNLFSVEFYPTATEPVSVSHTFIIHTFARVQSTDSAVVLSSITMTQPMRVRPLSFPAGTTCVGYKAQITKWLSVNPVAV